MRKLDFYCRSQITSDLAERRHDKLTRQDIEQAAIRRSNHHEHVRHSKQYFIYEASRWLTVLNRIYNPPKPLTAYDELLAEFRSFMSEDRGLSPVTVEYRYRIAPPFLGQLLQKKRSLKSISVSDIDSLLTEY